MASLSKQINRLQPFLNHAVSDDEILRFVLAKKPEDYFKNNDGNLLHVLSEDARQTQIFGFPRNGARDEIQGKLMPKLEALLKQEDAQIQCSSKEDGDWFISINNNEYKLGDLNLMYNWHVQGKKLQSPPDFYVKLADALEAHLSTGSLYFGYLKDEDQRNYPDFIYTILFVRHGDETALKRLSDLEWNPLSTKAAKAIADRNAVPVGKFRKEGHIRFRKTEKGKEYTWNSSNLFVGIFAYGLLVISVLDILNPYLKLNDQSLPEEVALPFYICAAVCFLLFLLNRKSKLLLTSTELQLKKGVFPLFFGFRRRTIALKDILRLDQKHVDMDEGNEVAMTGPRYMYKIYLTVLPTKKVRLTNLMRQKDADFLKAEIEAQLKKFNS